MTSSFKKEYDYPERVIQVKVIINAKGEKVAIAKGRIGEEEFEASLDTSEMSKEEKFCGTLEFNIKGLISAVASSMYLTEKCGENSLKYVKRTDLLRRAPSSSSMLPPKGIENYYKLVMVKNGYDNMYKTLN